MLLFALFQRPLRLLLKFLFVKNADWDVSLSCLGNTCGRWLLAELMTLGHGGHRSNAHVETFRRVVPTGMPTLHRICGGGLVHRHPWIRWLVKECERHSSL